MNVFLGFFSNQFELIEKVNFFSSRFQSRSARSRQSSEQVQIHPDRLTELSPHYLRSTADEPRR